MRVVDAEFRFLDPETLGIRWLVAGSVPKAWHFAVQVKASSSGVAEGALCTSSLGCHHPGGATMSNEVTGSGAGGVGKGWGITRGQVGAGEQREHNSTQAQVFFLVNHPLKPGDVAPGCSSQALSHDTHFIKSQNH